MIPTCLHFQQVNILGGGLCRIGVPDGSAKKPSAPPAQPAYRTCARCDWWKGPGQEVFRQKYVGVNVTVPTAEDEAMKRGMGIAPCRGCGQ